MSKIAKRPASRTLNAQHQAAFRRRHLGVDGSRVRLNMILPVVTATRLKRLALHYGVSQIEALERALASADGALMRRLKGDALRRYLDGPYLTQ